MTKAEINAVLKTFGYANIRMSNGDMFSSKAYKNWNGKMVKGIVANGIGPSTVTNVHEEHKAAKMTEIRQALGNGWEGNKLLVSETAKKKTYLVMEFGYYPAYTAAAGLDSAYQQGCFTFSYEVVDK